MEQRITIREFGRDTLDSVMELEALVWPQELRATREEFASRIEIFREGCLAAYQGDMLLGASTAQMTAACRVKACETWYDCTDNGTIVNSHEESGDCLYLVSVGAVPRSGAGTALITEQCTRATRRGARSIRLIARVPGFSAWFEQGGGTIEEYVEARQQGTSYHLDPVLRFYQRNGFIIDRIIENGFPEDKESRGVGCSMVRDLSVIRRDMHT